jgi:hypothetical protein
MEVETFYNLLAKRLGATLDKRDSALGRSLQRLFGDYLFTPEYHRVPVIPGASPELKEHYHVDRVKHSASQVLWDLVRRQIYESYGLDIDGDDLALLTEEEALSTFATLDKPCPGLRTGKGASS